jgi:homoserine dehydrogenase
MEKIKIGFLGLGVVGAELVNIVQNSRDCIKQNLGVELEIGKVFVRDPGKKRGTNIDALDLTTNPDEVINDPETDIICECIGGAGTELTYEYVMKAIQSKKSVVMSSKKTLAFYGPEILRMATEYGVSLKYDATVGGGIPIAKILENCHNGEKVTKISGILNATSNFIYTKMSKDNDTFEEALKKAQQNGYAENDPTEDIKSFDALYKSVILSMFGFGKHFDFSLIRTTPYSKIDLSDMKFANELGYTIKPVINIEDHKGKLLYNIGPCLIKNDDIIANTFSNFNIISITGTHSGKMSFYGQGAGDRPTASAMFDDVVGIITGKRIYKLPEISEWNEVCEKKNNQYIRVRAHNTIGKLNKITNILSERSINIEKILQKDKIDDQYDIILFTSSVENNIADDLQECLKNIDVELISMIPFLEN